MSADPLSETLALIDARCVLSRGLVAGGAWAMRFSPPGRLKITAVVRGSCRLTLDGTERTVPLVAGDVVVFNGGNSFVLAGGPAARPVDASAAFAASPGPVADLGQGRDTVFVGGHIDLGPAGDELLVQALPPLIHVRATADEAPVLRWLLDRILQEMTTGRAGSGFASDQLSQLVFVQVLRTYLADSQALPAGWLRALADERIAPALRLMHSDPGHPWQLGELARSAAMSRTAFATRFKAVAGVPPLTYLTDWRMRLARRALREEDTPLSALARSLGYTSESAFSTAFKRAVGVAPKRYRDTARGSGRQ
ncbi:AraC family transcriptional regulator [Actinomadura craniellae]|uniref:AraC family transcriptional regulator n=1 Tax=Actinomadura craniellae TaxID=2231787 RepID=A0A365H370_9ACTN|nr:AraC family transcriptional regulator [Actinomadura craniellae]